MKELIRILKLKQMINVSIVIPTYEMHNEGVHLLNILLNSIFIQTYKDFEIIVSDHSRNDVIEKFCKNYGYVRYFRNKENIGSSSANINNAINHSVGKFIKPLFQDDFFKTNDALKLMVDKMQTHNWVAVGSDQYEYDMAKTYRGRSPVINADLKQMVLGENYYGGPSCVLYKRHPNVNFDDSLIWLMDTWVYWQLHKIYGNPGLINDLLITTKYCETNVSATLATQELKQREYNYILNKIS